MESVQLYKTAPFSWDGRKRRAAVLVAEDDLPDEEIAKEIGVSRRTLATWKEHAEFAAEVGGLVGAIQASMLRLTIAKKHKRLERYQELWDGCKALRAARAKESEGKADWDKPMPGEATGLVATKTVGAGRNAIREAAFDAAVVKAELDIAEQAAKELGQWVEKSESEIRTNVVQLVGVEVEDI